MNKKYYPYRGFDYEFKKDGREILAKLRKIYGWIALLLIGAAIFILILVK